MGWDITMYTYWNCTTFACHFFPMMRDGVQNVCVVRGRYSTLPPPPPPASFATLYQHSPTRLILRGSPTRSRTLGTRFMDPTNPPTHPNPHGPSAEKSSPLRLSHTYLTILHPFAKPLKWRWFIFSRGQPYGAPVWNIFILSTLQIVKETHTLKNAIQHDIFTSEWSLQMVLLLGVTSRTNKPCQYREYPFVRGCCDRLS